MLNFYKINVSAMCKVLLITLSFGLQGCSMMEWIGISDGNSAAPKIDPNENRRLPDQNPDVQAVEDIKEVASEESEDNQTAYQNYKSNGDFASIQKNKQIKRRPALNMRELNNAMDQVVVAEDKAIVKPIKVDSQSNLKEVINYNKQQKYKSNDTVKIEPKPKKETSKIAKTGQASVAISPAVVKKPESVVKSAPVTVNTKQPEPIAKITAPAKVEVKPTPVVTKQPEPVKVVTPVTVKEKQPEPVAEIPVPAKVEEKSVIVEPAFVSKPEPLVKPSSLQVDVKKPEPLKALEKEVVAAPIPVVEVPAPIKAKENAVTTVTIYPPIKQAEAVKTQEKVEEGKKKKVDISAMSKEELDKVLKEKFKKKNDNGYLGDTEGADLSTVEIIDDTDKNSMPAVSNILPFERDSKLSRVNVLLIGYYFEVKNAINNTFFTNHE